jgi:hypothetical protein
LDDENCVVHALITALPEHAAAAGHRAHLEDFGLGEFYWGSETENPHGARLVTHYVGTTKFMIETMDDGKKRSFVDHAISGSAHHGYLNRILRREALLSEDNDALMLRGFLGMKRGVLGVIMWRRSRLGADSQWAHPTARL